MKVTLYTRMGCHLCDDAKRAIQDARRRAAFDYEEFDIDSDPELQRLYNEEVPVIAIDGRKAFKYHVTARLTLAVKIRELRPRVVIIPYWQARRPDPYRAGELSYEACFLAGLKKLDDYTEPHRPAKVLYSSLYANVTPSFVVDISAQFQRRMAALLSYRSQYGAIEDGAEVFAQEQEIRERHGALA